MTLCQKPTRAILAPAFAALAMFLFSTAAVAKKKILHVNQVSHDQALDDYVRQASQLVPNTTPTLGSLWIASGSMANLARDDKALHVGDVITINILETTTAQASGSAKGARSLSASSGLTALFGTLKPTNNLTNLFSPNSQEAIAGSETTSSTHLLSTDLTGTVIKVLPNGYLVVQAARDVYVDNQRQHVTVRGIVRPSDLDSTNTVSSSQVANLQVEVEGKGIVTDETRPPNFLTRLLLKLTGF